MSFYCSVLCSLSWFYNFSLSLDHLLGVVRDWGVLKSHWLFILYSTCILNTTNWCCCRTGIVLLKQKLNLKPLNTLKEMASMLYQFVQPLFWVLWCNQLPMQVAWCSLSFLKVIFDSVYQLISAILFLHSWMCQLLFIYSLGNRWNFAALISSCTILSTQSKWICEHICLHKANSTLHYTSHLFSWPPCNPERDNKQVKPIVTLCRASLNRFLTLPCFWSRVFCSWPHFGITCCLI